MIQYETTFRSFVPVGHADAEAGWALEEIPSRCCTKVWRTDKHAERQCKCAIEHVLIGCAYWDVEVSYMKSRKPFSLTILKLGLKSLKYAWNVSWKLKRGLVSYFRRFFSAISFREVSYKEKENILTHAYLLYIVEEYRADSWTDKRRVFQ